MMLQMEEIILSCGSQTQHLDHISAQLAALPITLSGAQPAVETLAQPPSSDPIQLRPCLGDNGENTMPSNVDKPIAAVHQGEQQKRGKKVKPVPCRLFSSVSTALLLTDVTCWHFQAIWLSSSPLSGRERCRVSWERINLRANA